MDLDLTKALILGLIEGLTEYIPVSSTGHLILVGSALELSGEKAATFDVCIQLGAILAVVVLYLQRFLQLIPKREELNLQTALDERNGLKGVRGLMLLLVGTLPALVLGALFHSTIKTKLFFPLPVALALIIGGIVMLIIERRDSAPRVDSLDQVTMKEALLIGIAQCFSLWPGMSRSGSTIIGGMLCGLERRVAAEFSFLLAVPTMCAAVGYDLLKSYRLLSFADLPIFAVGLFVSFVTAILAIRFLINILSRYTLKPFGYYRIVLGVMVLVMLR